MVEANPFEVTKAVDFSDSEISRTFVDLPGGGFFSLAEPNGPMPRYLVGGKGGGRTHLMRYFSFPLQQLRHTDALQGVVAEGYIGVYFRCGGLNAGRFSGKGQTEAAWSDIFAFYVDLWLTSLALRDLVELAASADGWTTAHKRAVVDQVSATLDGPLALDESEDPLMALRDALNRLRRDMDRSINNAALRREFDITIRSSPGELVFAFCRAVAANLPSMESVRVVFLLDELENFSASQQLYVNTLIREKEPPANFIIGSRRWGVRTMETLSAGEENRPGSEYDWTVLEDVYRENKSSFSRFCLDMVAQRLENAGFARPSDRDLKQSFADGSDDDQFRTEALRRLARESISSEPPYLSRLRDQLMRNSRDPQRVRQTLEALAVPQQPLLEKFAIYLFYREWATLKTGDALEDAAVRAGVAAGSLQADSPVKGIDTAFRHYREDLYAQLLADYQRPQEYLGIDRFIQMSGYLPRNLLIILKNVTRWSMFLGEAPFASGKPISREAQSNGVRESAAWFLTDSKALGSIGETSQLAVRRLGSFFRALRFSDKPVEVSCVTFSTDRQSVSELALATLDTCAEHSMLLEIQRGQKHRNSGVLHWSYQLNPMLSPNFDLPTARRGTVPLSVEEMNAIFDAATPEQQFQAVLRRRLASMNAPFGISRQDSLL